MARMVDIADATNVSIATVSRALKDDPRVAKKTKERILAAAAKLGYRPNPLIRTLMSARRRGKSPGGCSLAFVTTDQSSEAWNRKPTCRLTFDGVRQRAAELGFGIDIISTLTLGGRPLHRVLRARGIPGVIFGFSEQRPAPIDVDPTGLVTAGLGSYFPDLDLDRVTTNSFGNVQLGIRKLREQGHLKIGFVTPGYNNMLTGNTWSAAALEDARTQPLQRRCPPLVGEGTRCSRKEFDHWYSKHRPDAILAYKTDVPSHLRRLGSRVPVAWIYRNDAQRKSSAGVDGNLEKVGSAAVDLVASKLHTNKTGFTLSGLHILIDGRWIATQKSK